MANKQQELITAIDVGSAKTFVLVAEVLEGAVRYLGHGTHESRGSRKGAIVDLEKAVVSIQRAVEKGEAAAGVAVETAVVGIGRAHLRGVNSRGGGTLASRARHITRDDFRDGGANACA